MQSHAITSGKQVVPVKYSVCKNDGYNNQVNFTKLKDYLGNKYSNPLKLPNAICNSCLKMDMSPNGTCLFMVVK